MAAFFDYDKPLVQEHVMSDWIEQQVRHDFQRARFRAFLNAIGGALRGQPTTLLPFEEVRSRVLIRGQSDLGIRTVPLEQIVGSEGRYSEFDRTFLPRSEITEERWKNIGRAHYRDVALPPVELYKIGELYFVRDGNHRVSVARQRGQVDIDAHVIELKTDVDVRGIQNDSDLLLMEEQSDFLEWTGLRQLRPEASIRLSEPGGYLELIRHINGHRYFLCLERGEEPAKDEAVAHWYDHVYIPIVSAIRRSHVLEAFPGRTEADLYLWVIEHRYYLTQEQGHDPGAAGALLDYVSRFGSAQARQQVEAHKPWPEELEFLSWSGLDQSRPGVEVHLSGPAGYATLRQHIQEHCYYMGQELNRPVSIAEGAASWHDRVYHPVLLALDRVALFEHFDHCTSADLYLLVMEHLSYLHEQGINIDPAAAVEDYAAQFGREKSTLLAGALHQARRLLGRALRGE